MRHEAEQFDLWGNDLFRPAEIVPGTIVRLIWREPGRKPKPGPHRYRVISPALAFLLSGKDPGTMQDWELALVANDVALLAMDGPASDDSAAGDFLPRTAVFWRKREGLTAGY